MIKMGFEKSKVCNILRDMQTAVIKGNYYISHPRPQAGPASIANDSPVMPALPVIAPLGQAEPNQVEEDQASPAMQNRVEDDQASPSQVEEEQPSEVPPPSPSTSAAQILSSVASSLVSIGVFVGMSSIARSM